MVLIVELLCFVRFFLIILTINYLKSVACTGFCQVGWKFLHPPYTKSRNGSGVLQTTRWGICDCQGGWMHPFLCQSPYIIKIPFRGWGGVYQGVEILFKVSILLICQRGWIHPSTPHFWRLLYQITWRMSYT